MAAISVGAPIIRATSPLDTTLLTTLVVCAVALAAGATLAARSSRAGSWLLVYLAMLAPLLALAWTRRGLLPIVFVLTTAPVAAAAVVGWPAARRGGTGTGGTAHVALAPLALGPVTAATVAWVRGPSIAAQVGAMLVGLAIVLASARFAKAAAAIESAIARLTNGVASVVGRVFAIGAWLLTFLPVWAFNGVTGHSPLIDTSGSAGWASIGRSTGPINPRSLASSPALRSPRRPGSRRLTWRLGLVVVVVVAALVGLSFLKSSPKVDPWVVAHAYHGKRWAPEVLLGR